MDYKYMEIEQLVNMTKKGDSAAEEKLYFKFVPYISMLVSKFRIKGYDKDDLINECYIAFTKAINNYKGDSTFTSYVTKCLKNHILLLLRYSVQLEEVTIIDDILSTKSNVEDYVVNKLNVNSLGEALKKLTPKEAYIIEKYFFNDLSLVTISEIIDEKYITTVKTKDRALTKLRNFIN